MADHDHRAAAGISDPALRRFLEDHWEALLRRSPTFASRLGDRRFDDRLPGAGPEAHEARRAERFAFLERARTLAAAPLSPADRLTLDLFLFEAEADEAVDAFRAEEWQVLSRSNPVTFVGWLPDIRPLTTAADIPALAARYRAVPAFVEGTIETLRRGLAAGRVANRESLRRTAEMVRAELAKPDADWAAVARVPPDLATDELRAAVRDGIRPAFARYAAFLERDLIPAGREGRRAGLAALPEGEAAYAALVRRHTSLSLSAASIHRTGREELDRIHEEFRALGARALGSTDLPEVFRRLREDPSLRFTSAAEIEEKARACLAAANAAIPRFFGRLPQALCVVERVPAHEAPYTTIAYYRPPSGDGVRPGEYRVNVHAPDTRPRHEAAALAYHEAVPGHHLQIAIAMELPEVPAFRRHAGVTAYVEGWALYAERLAGEMGLYADDLDRLGMLSFDAWRAARLVVDTGIHTLGWTREEAVAFMRGNTPLADNNIDNEVDRYVSWPGQALSYKIGQIEIWRLRREAERRLGARFDIRAFHDAVLGAGGLPLPLLAARVESLL